MKNRSQLCRPTSPRLAPFLPVQRNTPLHFPVWWPRHLQPTRKPLPHLRRGTRSLLRNRYEQQTTHSARLFWSLISVVNCWPTSVIIERLVLTSVVDTLPGCQYGVSEPEVTQTQPVVSIRWTGEVWRRGLREHRTQIQRHQHRA